MTTPFTPFGDIFDSPNFFLDEPEFGFLGALGEQNLPRNMQQFFRQRTGDFLSRYNQALSGQILGGQFPNMNPLDFFRGQGGEFGGGFRGFREEYARTAPTERGFFSGRFAPSTRFLFR